jgi:putative addiction module killer protein
MASTAEAQGSTHCGPDPRACDRLIGGNPGDTEPIGGGLSELRIHHGAGYRVYYWQQGDVLLILLCGGDKSSQDKDIKQAHEIAKECQHRGN